MSRALTIACFALSLAGCGGTTFYRAGSTYRIRPDAPAQVDDEDIRHAFEAHPQLPANARIAYFTFDQSHTEELGRTLRELPGVTDVYEIAPLWVTGERRLEDP